MGLNRLCNIKYLNLDARSVNSKCEDCVNVARLLELQTRRASKKFIARGYFFNDLLESVCEKIPFYYSRASVCVVRGRSQRDWNAVRGARLGL